MVVVVPTLMVLATGEYGQLVLPLALTSFVVFVVSPIQDHLRRLFHLDQAAWQAARVSTAQAVTSVVAVAVLHIVLGDPAWTAFGGLAVANVLSTAYTLIGARRATRTVAVDEQVAARFLDAISVRLLTRMGWWLGTAGALSTGANLLVVGLISAVAGEAALGHAEAARTLAQPIVVVSMGLRSVYGPMVVVSLAFAWLGVGSPAVAAMARPAGMAALGLARWLSCRAAMVPHYKQKPAPV